jgi:hypothetical protein
MKTWPIYELGRHWITKTEKGFEVYRIEGVASVRCATIGFTGSDGLIRAIAECKRRESEPRWKRL